LARTENFSFKILIRREPDAWVARCLELNLVAVADTVEQAESDIIDVIVAHVRYALENDNLEYMFHPAPPHLWREFFECEDREEASYPGDETMLDEVSSITPIIQANKCFYRQLQPCHA
jgi:hypothetical protein